MKLTLYLEGERRAAEDCQQQYAPEISLFAQIVDLFDAPRSAVTVGEQRAEIPAHLLLVVQNQLYGVVSQMVRRRVADAKSLTRLAIEATGSAQLVWDDPSLAQVFADAYRKASDLAPDDPKRFLPSREYVSAFTSRELFKRDGEDWKILRVSYGLFSATSAHAGLGATIPHQFDDQGIRSNPFANDEELRASWYPMLRIYKAVWRVFFDILSGSGDAAAMERINVNFVVWWVSVCDMAQQRAPTRQIVQEDIA